MLLRRSAKAPNVVHQTVQGLTPGRLYSAKLISGDRQEFQKGVSTRTVHAVRPQVSGAEIIPDKSFQYAFNRCYSHHVDAFNDRNPYFMTLHRVVFRAQAATAELRFTDGAAPGTPAGPVGQELMCNFIEVQPYLE